MVTILSATACTLCGAAATEPFHDRVWRAPECRVFRCPACGVLFLAPPPDWRLVADTWLGYAQERIWAGGGVPPITLEALHVASWAALAVGPFADPEEWRATGPWLEVGCGTGALLDRCMARQIECVGVEDDEAQREFARGHGHDVRPALGDWTEGGRYELILFRHSFEHFPEPLPLLAECRRLLRPGGELLIEVPSGDDALLHYGPARFKDFYFHPAHPFVYGRESLPRLLDAGGFWVEATRNFQRYDLENHLKWLNGGPALSGLRPSIAAALANCYEEQIASRGWNDTLAVRARLVEDPA